MRRKSTTSEMMKSYIADALLLLMENRDFNEITVSEIVNKAGVNRSTYYRHFQHKEDVIKYFLEVISKNILKWDLEHESTFEEHLINLYYYYAKHKRQMMTIYRNNLSTLFLDILNKYIGADAYKLEKVNIQYDISYHIGGTFNHFMLWFSRDMIDTPEDMAKYTLSMIPEHQIKNIWNK